MQPKDIAKAYDKLTHRWTSPNYNLSNGVAQHEKALVFCKSRNNAIDIGCGCTGRFFQLLKSNGFKGLEGLDFSPKMLELAKQNYSDATYIHADICEYSLPNQYDFITAWDSIWHVPLNLQRSVLTKLVNALTPGGILIFSFGGTDSPGDHVDDAMGQKVYYSSLGTNGFLNLFMELGCVIRHLEFDQGVDLHAYMIIEKPS